MQAPRLRTALRAATGPPSPAIASPMSSLNATSPDHPGEYPPRAGSSGSGPIPARAGEGRRGRAAAQDMEHGRSLPGSVDEVSAGFRPNPAQSQGSRRLVSRRSSLSRARSDLPPPPSHPGAGLGAPGPLLGLCILRSILTPRNVHLAPAPSSPPHSPPHTPLHAGSRLEPRPWRPDCASSRLAISSARFICVLVGKYLARTFP